tara:strand:- start:78 stop:434 length:357 start_codon:yes stop_codon:yes gene_type:complete
MNGLEKFYFDAKEPNKSVFLALKDIIFAWDENVEQCLKYGLPCFTFKKKIMCYIWQDKKTRVPYVLFNYGTFINHKELQTKDRKSMKSMDISPAEDIPINDLINVLNQQKKHINSLKK